MPNDTRRSASAPRLSEILPLQRGTRKHTCNNASSMLTRIIPERGSGGRIRGRGRRRHVMRRAGTSVRPCGASGLACARRGACFKAGPSSQGSRRERNGSVALASSNGEGSLALVLSPDANEYYREVRGEEDGDERFLDAAPCDFFELLGVDTDASADDVKQAFRKLQRVAHPDIAGPTAEPLAVLLNSAYATLSDVSVRAAYQKTVELARRAFVGGSQFDGRPVSEWAGPRDEARAIFVDESTCIGCKSCVLHAPNTFEMVEDFNAGRARCVRQWGDDEETMQVAIELCPVDCIYWVKRNQLPIPRVRHERLQARGHRHHGETTKRQHGLTTLRTEPLHECGENAPPPKGGQGVRRRRGDTRRRRRRRGPIEDTTKS